jgi:hypothetical protein
VYRIWVLSAAIAVAQTFEGELQPLATARHSVRMEAGQFAIARARQVQGDFVLYLDKVKVDRSEGGGYEHALKCSRSPSCFPAPRHTWVIKRPNSG